MLKTVSKRYASVFLLIIFVFTIAVSFSACGTKTPVSGKWSCNIVFSDYIDNIKKISGLESLNEDDVKTLTDGVTVDVILNFKNNGVCNLEIDSEKLKEASDKLYSNAAEVVPKIIADQFGIDVNQIADYFAAMGINVEDAISNYTGSLGISTLTDAFRNLEMKYKYEDGKIYFGESDDFTENSYATVSLSESFLTITELHTVDTGSGLGILNNFLPVSFTKV